MYLSLAKAKRVEPVMTPLPYGAKALWTGSQQGEKEDYGPLLM